MSTPHHFVSVIVPTYNDSHRLHLCLQALEDQTYPKDQYEVIVVDNASDEDLKSVVSQYAQASYAYESQPGSYIARNTGIAAAKGELLAFTDSDCIPQAAWLETGISHFVSTPECGLVGGRIDLFFQQPNRLTAVELFEKIELNFEQDENVRDKHFAVTANLFTAKSVIKAVGPFSDVAKSGGDREWGERVFSAGYKLVYADDALVLHPARHSFAQLKKRTARFVGGRYDMMMASGPSRLDIVKDISRVFKPPFRTFYRIWKNQQLPNMKQKLQFTYAMFFSRYVVMVETFRLYFGGTSIRD